MLLSRGTRENKDSFLSWETMWCWDRFLFGIDWNIKSRLIDVDILFGFFSFGFLYYIKDKKAQKTAKKSA